MDPTWSLYGVTVAEIVAASIQKTSSDALNRLRALKHPAALSVYLVLGNQALVNWLVHGNSPEVVSLANEGIAAAKKDPSVPRWRVVTGETDLALYFIQEGKNAEAEALLKDALDLDNRAGRPGLATGVIASHLGTLRAQAGDLKEAEYYQHRYVEEMVRVVGPENARTGEAGVLWAVSLSRLGRNGEAVQECHQALAIVRAAEPARSPRLPRELSGCAFVLNQAGEAIEAEQNARESLQLLNGGRAKDPAVAQSLTELGVALVRQHRYEAAIPALAKGEQIFLDNPGYGAKHYSTIRASEALAAARAGLGAVAKTQK